MDQRARQVVDGVERGEADDKVEARRRERLLVVERRRLGLDNLRALSFQGAGQLAGPVTDHQRAARLVADERQPFEHILDHVVEHEPRGLGPCLPAGQARSNRASAVGVENARRGGHGGSLPRARWMRKLARSVRARQHGVVKLLEPVAPLIDLIYPPRCPLCGQGLAAQGGLCSSCWQELAIPGEPACALCQRPFADHMPDGTICAPCLAEPPRHDGIAAGTLYNDASRKLVLAFKHGRRIALAPLLSRLIAARLPQLDGEWRAVPVPLHRWRSVATRLQPVGAAGPRARQAQRGASAGGRPGPAQGDARARRPRPQVRARGPCRAQSRSILIERRG